MLSRKIFETLVTVMAILVLFKQFLRQILLTFFVPNSESFTKYDRLRFVRTFSICACLRRKGHYYQIGSKLRKNCTPQKYC